MTVRDTFSSNRSHVRAYKETIGNTGHNASRVTGPSHAFSELKKQLAAERRRRMQAESDRDRERADRLAIQDTLGQVLAGLEEQRKNGEGKGAAGLRNWQDGSSC